MKKYWKRIVTVVIGIVVFYLVWKGLMLLTEFINYVIWGI